ncbi:MAG: glycosyltransferase family 9 protein, partial [bacterium]|nr:glycosyltransferase family 9 protein [bacterium]
LADIYANCVSRVPWAAGRSLQLNVNDSEGEFILSRDPGLVRVAIHPGASQPDKRWPVHLFRDLSERLARLPNLEVVIVAGRRDVELTRAFEGIPGLVNLAGQTTPRDLANLFRECRLLISSDSGPMHVAAAVGTPVLDITMGSALASETAPYGKGHVVIEPDSECFPCLPQRPCSSGACGNRIAPETVLRLTEWMLGRRAEPEPPELPNCRVYRTIVSEADGLLAMRRVGALRPYERDEINERMRSLWLTLLDERTEWLPARPLADQKLVQRARIAQQAARTASRVAQQLAGAARRNRYTPTLHNLGELLFDQEQRVLDGLAVDNVLGSILAYLRIRRGSLSGDTVAEQARESADLYRGLARLLNALATPRTPENYAKNLHTDWIEDAHENSAQWT